MMLKIIIMAHTCVVVPHLPDVVSISPEIYRYVFSVRYFVSHFCLAAGAVGIEDVIGTTAHVLPDPPDTPVWMLLFYATHVLEFYCNPSKKGKEKQG